MTSPPISIVTHVKQFSVYRRSRVVCWRLDGDHSVENCGVLFDGQKTFANGTVLTIDQGRPVRIEYALRFDASSLSQSVRGPVTVGSRRLRIDLASEGPGNWSVLRNTDNGLGAYDVTAFQDATVVDLSFTPLTNTLAINCLNLSVGQSADIVAAWVRFPELTVELLPQRYSRLSEQTYRYENEGFSAELEVDDLNLVVRYGDLWERVAVSDGE